MGINDSFEAYYTSLYGKRWENLRKSLFEKVETISFNQGLKMPYIMDRASVLAAQALHLPEEGIVLDACAAPGGKSLVIASAMNYKLRLLANEFSGERRRRLVKVLNEHLDEERRTRVTVSGFDAATLGGRKTEFGRFRGVLLDVPCSSERHVIQNEKSLGAWKTARPRFLAHRQWALLSAAFLVLQPGTSLVYVTCALSFEENDGVVSRLLKKYKDEVLIDKPDFQEGENTAFGRIILPDVSGGMGPMYVARFKKR
jgi:16S rRNA (cytosine1407-C5)-methyltransferase